MFCSVDGCSRFVYSRDLCEMHFRQWLVDDDPEAPVVAPRRKTCLVHGCNKRVSARRLCHGHYQRLIRGSKLGDDIPLTRRKYDPTCSVEGCGRPTHGRGLCKTHHTRLQKFGDVRADLPIRRVRGDGHLHHGYRMVPVPKQLRHLTNGETPYAEHRLVMAMELGRPLLPDESVHHKNGIRTDNRTENLELWTRWQPNGQRTRDRISHAVEVLRQHRPELLAETVRLEETRTSQKGNP